MQEYFIAFNRLQKNEEIRLYCGKGWSIEEVLSRLYKDREQRIQKRSPQTVVWGLARFHVNLEISLNIAGFAIIEVFRMSHNIIHPRIIWMQYLCGNQAIDIRRCS